MASLITEYFYTNFYIQLCRIFYTQCIQLINSLFFEVLNMKGIHKYTCVASYHKEKSKYTRVHLLSLYYELLIALMIDPLSQITHGGPTLQRVWLPWILVHFCEIMLLYSVTLYKDSTMLHLSSKSSW